MADFAELAKNLLTLEINTVEKDGMSAQKMPTAPNALLEVVQVYWMFLCGRSQEFGPVGKALDMWASKLSYSFEWGREPFPPREDKSKRPVKNPETEPYPPGYNGEFLKNAPEWVDFLVLDHIREIAAWLTEMQSRTEDVARNSDGKLSRDLMLNGDDLRLARRVAGRFRAEERSVLHRIRRNADQFKTILDRIDPSVPKGSAYGARSLRIDRDTKENRFTATDLVAIRKAWDIGTEIVLMQTVIQIDGDVVNRFQTGMDTAERAPLHAIHSRAVDVSFRYWRWLADTMGRLAGKAVSTLIH